MRYLLLLLLPACLLSYPGLAQFPSAESKWITGYYVPGDFPIAEAPSQKQPAAFTAIYVDSNDHFLVQKAALFLQEDIERVTSRKPLLIHTIPGTAANLIIVGSIDRSFLIRQLAAKHMVATDSLNGKWEAYSYQVISRPSKGIGQALVITGSDRRGTAYGVLELSRQMGVSPWYWWADVQPLKKPQVYFNLIAWMKEHPDGYDHPAVKYRGIFINDEAPAFSGWARAKFDGLNHQVYEKVFELLLRLKANYLWPAMWGNAFNDDDMLNPVLADKYGIVMGTSHHEPMLRAQQEWKRYGSGPWNYDANDSTLRAFWKKGIEHMGSHESIVTIGMRGDGDMPMTEGSNIALLERIVADQRKIISKVTGKNPSGIPQLWALYKEVQDYYDKGMRVPDDVTLLLCDDNWGNIRKLPKPGEKPRGGGYGIYYHFDYVGDPRNYKWVNTNQVSRTWQQMHLAWQYGADRIWIVNAGDIKPMELPITFFLDYGWDPSRYPADSLPSYTRNWAAAQFGPQHAAIIGHILDQYTRYNSRRKPELLAPDTYSISHYREAETVVNDYNQLARQADSVSHLLPAACQDAYYQLVLYPVLACANLNELYYTVALNRQYAASGDTYANVLAEKARSLYARDSLLSHYYNKEMSAGKWDHMMDQTHIGYTYWQQPPENKMPEALTVDPASSHSGTRSQNTGPENPGNGFVETKGYISIESEHYSKAVSTEAIHWQRIPGLGRTLSGMEVSPVTASRQAPGGNSPRLEYRVSLSDTGTIRILACFSPVLDFNGKGLYYAISVDDEQPRIIDLAAGTNEPHTWRKMVADNIRIDTTSHHITHPGPHVIKYWMVDPAVVLQKIVLDAGGLLPSYLGPPENAGTKGLKDYYSDYFPIGTAVMPRSLHGGDSVLILSQFNSLTPENAMKIGAIHPAENRYSWKDADSIVNFAQEHGLKIRGHNLCWHEHTPAWLFIDSLGRQVTKEVLLQRLKDHISTVVSRYKGKVYAWDVVNEAVDDDSTRLLRNSQWYEICGEEFIAKAFEYAHQADPEAQLFYNDYNTERPEKRERVYQLLKRLIAAGVPITGVGIQAHWSIYEPSEKESRTTIEGFASLGLKVQITELDISIYPWEKNRRTKRPGEQDSFTPELEQRQLEQYRKAFAIFRDYKGVITGVTFWNISDRDTWLDHYPVPGRKNYPLLFDTHLQPKKAYWEVVKF